MACFSLLVLLKENNGLISRGITTGTIGHKGLAIYVPAHLFPL